MCVKYVLNYVIKHDFCVNAWIKYLLFMRFTHGMRNMRFTVPWKDLYYILHPMHESRLSKSILLKAYSGKRILLKMPVLHMLLHDFMLVKTYFNELKLNVSYSVSMLCIDLALNVCLTCVLKTTHFTHVALLLCKESHLAIWKGDRKYLNGLSWNNELCQKHLNWALSFRVLLWQQRSGRGWTDKLHLPRGLLLP